MPDHHLPEASASQAFLTGWVCVFRCTQAIGRAAIPQGYRVSYREANTQMEEIVRVDDATAETTFRVRSGRLAERPPTVAVSGG
jgi:hypothetical protein